MYGVRQPAFALAWRIIVIVLTVATSLLVATALQAVVSVQRGAASLNAALAALATDLSAPVPRPRLRELGEVGDGIAALAEALARAQVDKEHLGAELARKERLAALGRVAAGVAHEVRNPLASIKLRVEVRDSGAGVDPARVHELFEPFFTTKPEGSRSEAARQLGVARTQLYRKMTEHSIGGRGEKLGSG